MNKENRMKKQILLIFSIIIILFCLKFFFLNYHNISFERCEFGINRFEQEFFNIEEDSFDIEFVNCKNKFPSFFTDTSLDFKTDVFLNDTLRLVLDSVDSVFKTHLPQLEKLESGFCNYKNYFPTDSFSIYTYIEGTFDYRYPVVFANEKLFISLDLFLGNNHSFYKFLPDYIKFSHDTLYLPASCFTTLAGRHIPYPDLNNFLETILHYSKAYFFTQKMLIDIPEHHLFKCAEEKMKWCRNNEKIIWKYMIEKDYLFSNSSDLIDRFVSLAPFSKFGLDIDANSPGSVGIWLGLQILNSYADKNNVSLIDILNETDYMKILNKSGYKP